MEIKFFKKEKNFKKKEFVLNPILFWKIALGAAAVIILGTMLFSYFLFVQISKDSGLGTGSEEGRVPRVDNGRIDRALLYFYDRENKSVEIINSPAPVVDPSI